MAMAIGTAQAHQMLYDQDGYRLAVGIEAGLGGFLVGNVDTGLDLGAIARGAGGELTADATRTQR